MSRNILNLLGLSAGYHGFSFKDGGRGYWIVKGKMPLDIAEKSYNNNPIVKSDVRAGGHCGCVPPRSEADFFAKNGKKVIAETEKDLCNNWLKEPKTDVTYQVAEEMLRKYEFDDTYRTNPEYTGFVELYHIDTEVGLLTFKQMIDEIKGE